MKTIEEIKKEVAVKQDELSELNKQLMNAEFAKWHADTGINIGDEISFKDGRKMVHSKLTSMKYRYGNVYPVSTLFKSDGTLGLRTKEHWSKESLIKLV